MFTNVNISQKNALKYLCNYEQIIVSIVDNEGLGKYFITINKKLSSNICY